MIGFIADEHIPLPSILALRDANYRVVSIREEYRSALDEFILRLADEENLVIITNDRDFGELIFKEEIPFSAGLIYCRLEQFRPREIAETIIYHLNEFSADFEGKFTVLAPGRFRQRQL